MAIEAVTFDLDNTLLRYTESPDAVLDRCFAWAGYDPFFTFEDYLELFEAYIDEADSPLELRTAAFTALAREHGYDAAAGREIAEQWGAAHAAADVELCPGADRVLETCRHSVEVGLITNGPSEAQRPKMEATGLAGYFDAEVFAADDLRFKPDPDPFERALDALGSDPPATVHVGDSFEADIEGATDIGMQAVWVADGDAAEPQSVPRVNTVGELLGHAAFSDIG